ncbi:methyl-CpG-binding domain protein 6 isoform X2 [Apteryx mantelli]|uniref:Methyl-CpG-binding domain protein 6 isoform X2 n=1 Tax=Apteryx mantelli TaxID=2696672 RepID=A0ABM4FYU7_9AVES
MHKVFNFDPGAAVAGRGAPGTQGQQDMTKLCNHRRKTVAMATLYRSMEGAPGPGSRRPGTGPGLSPLFPAGGRPAVPPGVPPPGAVGSFPRAPTRAKTPEAAPAGDRLVPPPFPRPRDVFPGANGSPESRPPPPSPRFGRRLPPPDAAVAPRPPAEDARSHRPVGRTSARAAPSPVGAGESPEPGGPGLGPCPAAANGAPQVGKDDSPVSGALTNQSSNNLPVPLDAAPEGRGFLGLPLGQLLAPPAGTPFPASSLLSAAAKAQLGGPDPVPPPSTLPPRPLAPDVLLSVAGERSLGKAARRPRRLHPEDPAARRAPPAPGAEPKGLPAPGQPLAALLSLLGAQGGPGGHGGPPAPPPAGDGGAPCPGTGLLPACQDFNSQLLGLFGQLAASSEATSGTPPQPKHSAPGAATSPAITKGPPALGASSGGEEAAGGALGCPLPPAAAAEPVAFVGQEQALALGGSLPPGLLLGTLPFSVALGQHPPAPGGDPEGPSLPSLLAASLLPGQPPVPLLPLGVPLPALDLLPAPGTLLSALLPLAPAGEKGAEAAAAAAASPEGYPALPDAPLLFSALPASLALDPALLAAGLGPPESTPGAPPSGLASPPAAPTSTGAPPTTTEAPRGEGRAPDGPPGTPGRLHPLGPQLGSSLVGATLLGDLPALSPLLQNQPLLPPALPPLGLALGPGQGPLLGAASPLACLLQSLQLGPGFGPPEKPATLSGPSAGGPPSPPGCPEGPLSALEPPAPSRAEAGSASPGGGARGGPGSRPSLKRGRRRRAEGLNGETPAPRGPPSTKSPRRGAGRGRGGWGARRHFNGQAGDGGEKGAPPAAPPAPHPAWRCNGDIPAAERQLKAEEIKGSSLRLRPSRRGRRRKASAPRPSARLETPRGRGLSAEPGAGPAVDPALARRPRPGRPVKNRRRKLLT